MLPPGSKDFRRACSMDEGIAKAQSRGVDRKCWTLAQSCSSFRIFGIRVNWMQVPLYMTLGLAVAFALTFSIVDAGISQVPALQHVM